MLGSELARRVGIDATALSKIENGRRSVKSVELGRIAKALRVSPLALLEPDSLPAKIPLAARMSGATVTMGSAYDKLVSLTELHEVLAENGIHSSPMLASVPSVVGAGWFEAAETLATWARDKLPLKNVDGQDRFAFLANHVQTVLGIDVLVEPFQDDPLTGAAITDRAFPLLFVNAAHALPRSLFTLAHELGHVLARHNGGTVTLDRELSGTTSEERMANAFAASFLMPEDTVRGEVAERGRTETALIVLAYRLGVSFETLIFRLHNLGLINAAGRDGLRNVNWRQLVLHMSDPAVHGRQGAIDATWFMSRSVTPPAAVRPAMLIARATTGFHKGIISANALANLVGRDSDDLLDMFGADPDLASARELISADYRPKQEEAREKRFSGLPY